MIWDIKRDSMRNQRLSPEEREKQQQAKELAKQKHKDMEVFVDLYIDNHTFISSKNVAIKYSKCDKSEKPPQSLVSRFGQILRKCREKGVLEKYNTYIYKKVAEGSS